MDAHECEDEEFAGADYVCGVCRRCALRFDGVEILEWEGGGMVMAGETDPLMLGLVCPECAVDEAPAA